MEIKLEDVKSIGLDRTFFLEILKDIEANNKPVKENWIGISFPTVLFVINWDYTKISTVLKSLEHLEIIETKVIKCEKSNIKCFRFTDQYKNSELFWQHI